MFARSKTTLGLSSKVSWILHTSGTAGTPRREHVQSEWIWGHCGGEAGGGGGWGLVTTTLHRLRWQMYQSLIIYSRSLNDLSQDQLGGPAEETGGAGAGRAAAETPGGLPDAEAEGGRAEGRRLWEDLRAGRGERRGGLQGLPPPLRADHGEEGNLVGTGLTRLFCFLFFFTRQWMHILISPDRRRFVQNWKKPVCCSHADDHDKHTAHTFILETNALWTLSVAVTNCLCCSDVHTCICVLRRTSAK